MIYDRDNAISNFLNENAGLVRSDEFQSLPTALYKGVQRKELPVATTPGIPNKHLSVRKAMTFPSVRISRKDGDKATIESLGKAVEVRAEEETVLSLSPVDVETTAVPTGPGDSKLTTEKITVTPQIRVVNHGQVAVVALS